MDGECVQLKYGTELLELQKPIHLSQFSPTQMLKSMDSMHHCGRHNDRTLQLS